MKSTRKLNYLILIALLAGAVAASDGENLDLAESSTLAQADWVGRATRLEQRAEWPGLLAWGERWTRARPADATAWFVLGRAYSKLTRYPEAILAYRQNLKLEPGDIHALNNLGNVYRESRLFRDALTAYRDAVQISPDYIQAWHNLGLTLFELKGVAGVTRALQQLQASDPVLADAWRRLAIEYSLSRDPRVAQKAIAVLRGLDADQRRRMFEILFVSV